MIDRSLHFIISSFIHLCKIHAGNGNPSCLDARARACSEYSTELNAARIKLLQAQDDVVTGVKESAGDALLRVTKDANAYKRVLKGLIVQVGCVALLACQLINLLSTI